MVLLQRRIWVSDQGGEKRRKEMTRWDEVKWILYYTAQYIHIYVLIQPMNQNVSCELS